MSGAEDAVGLAGLGLIVVNAFTGPQRAALDPIISGDGSLDSVAAHKALMEIGAEIAGVVVLILVARTNNGSKPAVAIVASLWLVWLMTRPNPKNPFASSFVRPKAAAAPAPVPTLGSDGKPNGGSLTPGGQYLPPTDSRLPQPNPIPQYSE